GRIVAGHELQPSSTATTVRIGPDGGATVTDGPFVEGKEVVGGFAILDVADLDEALAIASSWPVPDTIEIRPIVERG
ncbi:MAG: YciI family protein, partial [Chloroflexota bacterium]|nr:YciI family protein [Chloroflexota bacterium]